MKRDDALEAARGLINGPRQDHYGTPAENFGRIAARWSQTLGVPVQPWQVAVMMADLKLARLANGLHEDSFLDGIGYLALAAELSDV